MKKHFKPVTGILLIILAIGLLLFWEVRGRELVLMENVLVAREEIWPGVVVNAGMFKETGILSENMIENGMVVSDISQINGKVSNQIVPKNSQISAGFFSEKKLKIQEGFGIYQIKSDWIFSVSSSTRKNDIVKVYRMDGKTEIGSFTVAFVKDGQGKEVVDEISKNGGLEIIERFQGSGVVSGVEIVATPEQYGKILEYVCLNEGQLILLNRKE